MTKILKHFNRKSSVFNKWLSGSGSIGYSHAKSEFKSSIYGMLKLRYNFTRIRITMMRTRVTSVGKHVLMLEYSSVAGGNVEWYCHFGKQFHSFLKC